MKGQNWPPAPKCKLRQDMIDFKSIFWDLHHLGEAVYPRGLLVKELEDYSYMLQPYVRFASFKSRNLNLNYIKQEFLWYNKGDRYDKTITEHASMWKRLINKDGSINSNYGQYIFTNKQFDKVIETLIGDRDSRRASIVILNEDHLSQETNDVPCTYALSFRIRSGRLNMSVSMRSQDAIFGMCNDAPAFSIVQEMICCILRETYPELELGTYNHNADSFHVYERHFDLLGLMIRDEEEFETIECPRISCGDEVRFLRKMNFTNIPTDFRFTKWLQEESK